jgi:L-alanine-DL-glutamate epimerase-like enolase superfamily enzyme
MRINTVGLYRNAQPFKFNFDSPHTRRSQAEAIILVLEFDNGIVSFGESTPRAYVTAETCTSVIAAIGQRFVPLLLASTMDDRQDVIELLARLSASGADSEPSALGAVDIALWDALAQLRRLPVFGLFSPSPRPQPPYSVSIPYLPLETIQALYQRFRRLDIKRFKILLTGDWRQDLKRIQFIRKLVGETAALSLEANGKLDVSKVMAVLERLAPGAVQDIEQPAAAGNMEALRQIRERFGLAVVADESMCCLDDARRLVDAGACDILNVKISKCGGLLRAREIIVWAAGRNIACHLGSHVGETEILAKAAQHLALSTENLAWMEIGSFILTNGVPSRTGVDPLPPPSIPSPGLGLVFGPDTLNQRFGRVMAEFHR